MLPVPADSSTPAVSQPLDLVTGNYPVPVLHGTHGRGVGKSQPLVQVLAGWERGTEREQGLSLSQSVQVGISRAKGGEFCP